jgi:bifunctional DNA-binding transcriptional regulator/antitoxin component of YhaV-PrlF toxin-antitoxin module
METLTISPKFQIVIPKAIRKALGGNRAEGAGDRLR